MHFHGLKKITNLTATLDTTAVPGILTNSTDDPIAANNRQDYSFKPHEDFASVTLSYDGTAAVRSRLAGSDLPSSFYYDDTPQHDGSHGAIVLKVWCKDFGGNCEIEFTSGTAELWGVAGTLDFSGLKVELPFTTRDAPLEPLPFDEWLKREVGGPRELVDGQKSTWLQFYGDLGDEYEEIRDAVEEARRKLRTVKEEDIYKELETDKEPKHPGKPYPYTDRFKGHREEGDSLTLWQEYYGFFWVTGGGFKRDGTQHSELKAGEWRRVRVRLSPAVKELLVEVDVMKGLDGEPILNVAGTGGVIEVMDEVSRGFSDSANGCGARVYYRVHEWDVPHKIVQHEDDPLIVVGINADLREHVHVVFADADIRMLGRAGQATPLGSLVYVGQIGFLSILDDLPRFGCLKNVTLHEVIHLLLDVRNRDFFDKNEHVTDGDEDGTPDEEEDDKKFLMYPTMQARNVEALFFSNPTRRNMSFATKQGVFE